MDEYARKRILIIDATCFLGDDVVETLSARLSMVFAVCHSLGKRFSDFRGRSSGERPQGGEVTAGTSAQIGFVPTNIKRKKLGYVPEKKWRAAVREHIAELRGRSYPC